MLKIVYYKGRKCKITYRNDVVFKQTLGGEDKDSKILLKFVAEAVIQKRFTNLRVRNSEILGRYVFDKKNYLDIHADEEKGDKVNIEMQQSDLKGYDLKRFQGYNYRMVSNQLGSGDEYKYACPVSQIVFTTGYFDDDLLVVYKQRKENGEVMPDNLSSFYIVSLPRVSAIVEKKKKTGEKLTDLEVIAYIYQNGVDDDIISLADERQKKVILLMKKKYEATVNTEELLDEATKAAYYESWLEATIEHYENKGIDMGINMGARKDSLIKTSALLLKKYNCDVEWLESCTLKQLDLAFELALDDTDYEELKKRVLKK